MPRLASKHGELELEKQVKWKENLRAGKGLSGILSGPGQASGAPLRAGMELNRTSKSHMSLKAVLVTQRGSRMEAFLVTGNSVTERSCCSVTTKSGREGMGQASPDSQGFPTLSPSGVRRVGGSA